MAQIRVDVPDSQIEAATQAELKRLRATVTRLENKIAQMYGDMQEANLVIERENRLRHFIESTYGWCKYED